MILSSFQQQSGRGNPTIEFEGHSIDEMISTFMRNHDIPGLTLAIVQAPYISRVIGYGLANVQNELLASPKTLWNIGQMTCAYTAIAIMQLVEENKLTLDEPIGKLLPQVPTTWQKITLRQLMGNSSGIPDYTKQSSFDFSKHYQPQEILAFVQDLPLNFQPGSQVSQSATNFFLLGLVIENASGMSYENFVKKNQIDRLGLKNTLFPSDLRQVKQEDVANQESKHKQFLIERAYIDPTEIAIGYNNLNGEIAPVKMNSPEALYAYGSLLSSAEDMSLWDIALAGQLLIKKKENRDILYHAISLNDGTKVQANGGWRFYGHEGLMSIQGNVPGFSCYMSRFTHPSELLCVTLCANKDNIDFTELARHIAGAFNRKLGPPFGPKSMKYFESSFNVQMTMDRFEEFLKKKNVQIMARVDHAAGAKKVGLELRPTQTLIFGNPALGTHLMLANQGIAADLPLRIAVWQGEDGSVWLGHEDIRILAESYGIVNIENIIEQMNKGLEAAVKYAIAPY